MRFEPGSQIDRYKIEAIIGEGGMGRVCRAFDTRLHRRVAVKVLLLADGADLTDAVASALREARAAAAIAHPNATSVYDADEIEGLPYIVMEYVPGTSLRQIISGPPVPMALRLRWLVDVAGALAAAHQVGIIHRDVKPENVMVREDGLVKVLDFGVARRTVLGNKTHDSQPIELPPTPSSNNSNGRLVGTPAYMPPEQIRGEPIDGRADQFAWGVLAYELLTGHLPWKTAREFLGFIAAVLTEKPEPLRSIVPDIPAPVEAAILRALAKNPHNRFATISAAATELMPFAQDPFTGTTPHDRASPPPPVVVADTPRSPVQPFALGEHPRPPVQPFALGEHPRPLVQPFDLPRTSPRATSEPRALAEPRSTPDLHALLHAPPALLVQRPRLEESHRPIPAPPPSRPAHPPPSPPPRLALGPPSSPLDVPSSGRPLVRVQAAPPLPPLPPLPDPMPPASSIPPARSSSPVPMPSMHSVRRTIPDGYAKLREPRFDAPVDVDAHVALLGPDATCKGMFFIDLLREGTRAAPPAEMLRSAQIEDRRQHSAFRDYPAADGIRLAVAVARAVYPRVSLGEGLRRLGQTIFDSVLGTQIGRTTLGILGGDIEKILLTSPKTFKHFVNFGRVTCDKSAPHTYVLRTKEFPIFLETFSVGVLEGALRHCRVQGKIRITLDDLSGGLAEVRIG